MPPVDLRSDTVTLPTPEMYEAMRKAPLGDDVLGDDPTVARLEELAAHRVDKQAALFVPSGTMGNQIALAVHTRPGDAVIFEEDAHMLLYEAGAPGAISHVVPRIVVGKRGVMDPDEVERKVLVRTHHTPGTVLLCVEDTHNRAGGAIVPLKTLTAYNRVAARHGMAIHLDGARMFNASVAQGVDVEQITRNADTVSFCLSKGLGAPVGSLLCGPTAFIEEARYWRKRLGGGMRQAGILAACGIVALDRMVERLAEDHARARRLAEGLADVPGVKVDLKSVQTNMVMVDTTHMATLWVQGLARHQVRALPIGPYRIRLVVHKEVDEAGIEKAIRAFAACAKTCK